VNQSDVPQGRALIGKAVDLGVPIDDLLTVDGEEIAWTVLRDFKAQIGPSFLSNL
jgi:hypothetical protein